MFSRLWYLWPEYIRMAVCRLCRGPAYSDVISPVPTIQSGGDTTFLAFQPVLSSPPFREQPTIHFEKHERSLSGNLDSQSAPGRRPSRIANQAARENVRARNCRCSSPPPLPAPECVCNVGIEKDDEARNKNGESVVLHLCPGSNTQH